LRLRGLLPGDHQLEPAVPRPALVGLVRGDGVLRAHTVVGDPLGSEQTEWDKIKAEYKAKVKAKAK
jgi:hypothetical protein